MARPVERGPQLAVLASYVALAVAIAVLLTAGTFAGVGAGAQVRHLLIPSHSAPGGTSDPGVGTAGRPVATPPAVITIMGYDYAPADLTVSPGAVVTVTNRDSSLLSVTALDGAFDTGLIAPGGVATFVAPTSPGRYAYRCTVLPTMSGSLVVE